MSRINCNLQSIETKNNLISVTAPAPTTGSITVNSNPSGATVFVDGVQQSGTTPLTVQKASAGSHTVVVRKTGYTDYTTTVQVTAGQPVKVNAELTQSGPAPATTGSLSVSSTPAGASVYIADTYRGATPLTVSGLSPGSYQVKIKLSGYADYSGSVSVVAGQITQLSQALTKISGTATTTTTPPVQGTGSVNISSSPSGASVNLDGWQKGTTPTNIEQVKAGSHTLTLSKTGYDDFVTTISVAGGQTTSVTANLAAKKQGSEGVGTLVLRSVPTGANVYLDGKSMDKTPVTLQNVPAGSHTVLFTMQGYNDDSRTIEVASGAESQIDAALTGGKKAPGFTFAVVIGALAVFGLFRMFRRD